MTHGRLLLALLTLSVIGQSSGAQVNPRNRPDVIRPGRGAVRPGGQLEQRRALLEQQLRRGFWRIAKQRAGLTDEQMVRLEQIGQRYDERRRTLMAQERTQRIAIRREVLADTAADHAVLSAAMDELLAVQRRRLDLQQEEQRELSTFMTPLQRARFVGLQDQLRRRMQELVDARPDSAVP